MFDAGEGVTTRPSGERLGFKKKLSLRKVFLPRGIGTTFIK